MFKLVKIISRIAHMLSTALISGMIILNYLFSLQSTFNSHPGLKKLHVICGTVLIVSGFANIFLIRGKKKLQPEHMGWKHLLYFKFFLGLLLTPLVNIVLKPFVQDEAKFEGVRGTFWFYLVLFMYVFSTLIKTYREDYLNNFDKDPLADKVQQLHQATQPKKKD